MGPLDRLPHLHPSLSLPSLSHRKSTSRVHHHLKSPRARRRPSSTLIAPLLEHPSPSRICSLCQQGIPVGIIPYHFPKTAPAAIAALNPYIQSSASPHAFCYACWVWIHNLSLCWTCGDTVSRHEGRVSFGWCWWHWACVSCLFCRVCDSSIHSIVQEVESIVVKYDVSVLGPGGTGFIIKSQI